MTSWRHLSLSIASILVAACSSDPTAPTEAGEQGVTVGGTLDKCDPGGTMFTCPPNTHASPWCHNKCDNNLPAGTACLFPLSFGTSCQGSGCSGETYCNPLSGQCLPAIAVGSACSVGPFGFSKCREGAYCDKKTAKCQPIFQRGGGACGTPALAPNGCEPDSTCVKNPLISGSGRCQPRCTTTAECPCTYATGGVCNTYSGRCLPRPPSSAGPGGSPGGPCSNTTDCKNSTGGWDGVFCSGTGKCTDCVPYSSPCTDGVMCCGFPMSAICHNTLGLCEPCDGLGRTCTVGDGTCCPGLGLTCEYVGYGQYQCRTGPVSPPPP